MGDRLRLDEFLSNVTGSHITANRPNRRRNQESVVSREELVVIEVQPTPSGPGGQGHLQEGDDNKYLLNSPNISCKNICPCFAVFLYKVSSLVKDGVFFSTKKSAFFQIKGVFLNKNQCLWVVF